MRTLTIVDKISHADYSYSLPGDWNELLPRQLLFLIGLMAENVTAEEIKLKMLLFCMNAHVRQRNIDMSFRIKQGRRFFDLSAMELHAVCDIFDYLFVYKDNQPIINPLLTVNPFPVIRLGLKKLYGPADGLTDIIYETFVEMQIRAGGVGESSKCLNDILSILYKLKNGKRTMFVRWIPHRKKIAILWFFLGSMRFLQEQFPLVFAGTSEQQNTNVADGQFRIIDVLAKNDVTKKEKVKKSLLYDALYTMQMAAEEFEKMRRK